MSMQTLLKPSDVARRLGVSRTWLYEAAKQGRIPCVRIGGPDGPLRFVEADVERWIHESGTGRGRESQRPRSASAPSGNRAG
jgi:excisionase family DNA binding protein